MIIIISYSMDVYVHEKANHNQQTEKRANKQIFDANTRPQNLSEKLLVSSFFIQF